MNDRSYETAAWLGFYVQKHFPNDSGVSYAIGRQWLIKGSKRRASEFFEKALTQKPVWPNTYTALAELRFAQSRRDEAIKFADDALKVNPADEAAMAVKVAAQAELSGHPERYLIELERFAPRNWMNDATSTMLAQAYINTGQWDKALKPALYGLKYASGTRVQVAHDQIIKLMHHVPSGEMISQINYLSPLRTQDFQSTVLRMRFAKCLSDIGAHEQSTKMLLQALQQHSYFAPMLNFRLGQEMEALHRDDEAVYFYRTAHQLRTSDEDYAHAYERAEMRYKNQRNDLARKLKRAMQHH
jgi:tetratricopeptide (TPR) repeat protein